MDEIGFPKNLPEEFRNDFALAFNEIIRLREENNSLKRIFFAQRSERYVTQNLLIPKDSLFNEPEKIILENIVPEEKNNDDLNPKKEKTKLNKTGGKKPFPKNIPREKKIHDLPEEEKVCKYDNTHSSC